MVFDLCKMFTCHQLVRVLSVTCHPKLWLSFSWPPRSRLVSCFIFTSQSLCQFDILCLEGHPLCMNGNKVGIFKEVDEESFCRFLGWKQENKGKSLFYKTSGVVGTLMELRSAHWWNWGRRIDGTEVGALMKWVMRNYCGSTTEDFTLSKCG